MRKDDGSWTALPPDYPPIVAPSGEVMNLRKWRNVQQVTKENSCLETHAYGIVLTLQGFNHWYSSYCSKEEDENLDS